MDDSRTLTFQMIVLKEPGCPHISDNRHAWQSAVRWYMRVRLYILYY